MANKSNYGFSTLEMEEIMEILGGTGLSPVACGEGLDIIGIIIGWFTKGKH